VVRDGDARAASDTAIYVGFSVRAWRRPRARRIGNERPWRVSIAVHRAVSVRVQFTSGSLFTVDGPCV